MVNIRRGWTIPARPEEADREERRQRRLLDTEFRRWAERPPQPSPKPEEEGPVQLARTQGLFGLRAPTVAPPAPPAPPAPEPPPRELAEAFAPAPSGAFDEAPLSAFGQLEEERVQRGAEGAREFAESIQGRPLQEVALLMGLAEVARQRGVTPQQLLAEPGETDFELTNLQREVQLASRPFLEELEPSGDPLAVGKRFGLGAVQLAQEAEALERRTLAPVTRPVGRAVTQAVTDVAVPRVPLPLRAAGVPDFPGREEFREQAGEVGETVGEFGLVPSNLIPIPIADDILRVLAKGVPIAARLLTRAGRQATREELKQLAEGAVRFVTRTPPTDPAERALAEQAVEPLTRAAAAREAAPARGAEGLTRDAPSVEAVVARLPGDEARVVRNSARHGAADIEGLAANKGTVHEDPSFFGEASSQLTVEYRVHDLGDGLFELELSTGQRIRGTSEDLSLWVRDNLGSPSRNGALFAEGGLRVAPTRDELIEGGVLFDEVDAYHGAANQTGFAKPEPDAPPTRGAPARAVPEAAEEVAPVVAREVAPAPPGAEKQPWQMTREEWQRAFDETRPDQAGFGTRLGGAGRATSGRGVGARFAQAQERQQFLKMGLSDTFDYAAGTQTPARHFDVVREAAQQGLPVPEHVLAEYPQLRAPARAAGEVVEAVPVTRSAQRLEELRAAKESAGLLGPRAEQELADLERAATVRPVGEVAGPPRLETLADDAARLADEGLPPVGGGAVIGLPSPRTLKTVEEIAIDARRSTQNAFGALTRGAARFGPTRTLADFINPSALIDAPPANLVNEIGEEAASQLQSNLVAHARQMDQGSAIAAAIEEGVQTRARAVGLEVQDGLVVSVKGSPPVGDLFENPSRYALTPDQRQLVDEVQTVLNDMNFVEKAAGVKKGQLFSGEGRYFPRLVREVRGVENQRAQVRRIVGGRQGFTRERFYETMQEGMDAGIRYEDDIGAIVGTRIRAGMKATGDESLGQLIRPLGRTLKAPRAGVAIGETGTMVPALGGRAFPTETGRAIMDALSPAPPGSTLRFTDALNNVLRPIQATGELSFWGIQMLGSIFRNPAAFAKGAVMSLDGLLLDGRMYGRYIQNNSDWINRFVRGNGVWNSSEFTFDQAVRNKTIRNVFARTGIKGALGRFDQAFNQGLNVTALENFKGMVGLGDSVGFEKFNRAIRAGLGDFAGETTDEVAASVASKMTGRLPVRGLGVKATQRSVESALAFAPRYYRAMFGLLGDAIQGGMRGAEAKRVLGSLFAGALATHVAVAHGLGQEPNLDPRNSNFLTVRVGKTKMGVGGPIYGLGRMIAESVENPDKLRSVNMDNPLVRWARGRAAPVLSLATDLVTQETFMGEKIDSVGDLFREIATTPLPFIAQQTIEEGPEGFPPQFFGLRAFPAGARERFEDLYQEKYGTPPQRGIAPRTLDPELAAQAGYDPARETEFGQERAGITAGEEDRLADLSRIVLTGQPDAMEQFEEELGDFFRFRSGVTEALVRNLGLPEREASLVQDFYDLDPRDRRDPETGKPDWDHFESQRERVLSQLRREGPSGREAASALERGTGISFPDPDLQRVYDARRSLREGLDAYYDTDSKKREAYRRRNPGVDAKLYLLGRVSRVVTGAAQREVRSLSRSLLGTEVEAGRGERRQRRFGEPIRIGPREPIAIGR